MSSAIKLPSNNISRVGLKGFEDVCATHGGRLLEGGLIPRTDLKIYQPFMRFEYERQGVILALASMPVTRSLPAKNKSRLAGVSINYDLSLRLDFDGMGPNPGDIFAVLLIARDRQRAGKIEELAVGVIESNYESYLYYEPLEEFLAGEVAPEIELAPPLDEPAPQVTLKKAVAPLRSRPRTKRKVAPRARDGSGR